MLSAHTGPGLLGVGSISERFFELMADLSASARSSVW